MLVWGGNTAGCSKGKKPQDDSQEATSHAFTVMVPLKTEGAGLSHTPELGVWEGGKQLCLLV